MKRDPLAPLLDLDPDLVGALERLAGRMDGRRGAARG